MYKCVLYLRNLLFAFNRDRENDFFEENLYELNDFCHISLKFLQTLAASMNENIKLLKW